MKTFIVLSTSLVNSSKHTKYVTSSNQRLNLLLSIYIPMNTVKNYTTIHFRFNQINVSNKVFVPNKIEDLNIHVFNMITGKNDSKLFNKINIMRMQI